MLLFRTRRDDGVADDPGSTLDCDHSDNEPAPRLYLPWRHNPVRIKSIIRWCECARKIPRDWTGSAYASIHGLADMKEGSQWE